MSFWTNFRVMRIMECLVCIGIAKREVNFSGLVVSRDWRVLRINKKDRIESTHPSHTVANHPFHSHFYPDFSRLQKQFLPDYRDNMFALYLASYFDNLSVFFNLVFLTHWIR